MTNEEKNIYEALKESDKITGKDEANKYINRINENKKKITININNKDLDNKYTPKWLIISIISQIILFSISMDGIKDFLTLIELAANGTLSEYGQQNFYTLIFTSLIKLAPFLLINISFWLYSLISIIKYDFINPSNKTMWTILIIFLPFTWMLFLDFKEIQIIKKNI